MHIIIDQHRTSSPSSSKFGLTLAFPSLDTAVVMSMLDSTIQTVQWPMAVLSWTNLQQLVLLLIGTVVTLFAVILNFSKDKKSKRLNLPPGPKPLPIIGNLHQLGPVPHRTVAELTRKYGPIVFLKLGSQPVVISSDPHILNDILKVQDQVFSSRPHTICSKTLTYEMQDFIMAPYGDHWRAMRRICVQELLSTRKLESFAATRQEEVNHLIRAVWDMRSSEGEQTVDIRHKIESYAMNVMTDMILGKKYFGTHLANQDENNEVLRLLMDSFQFFGVLNIGDYIKWLAPLDLQGYKRKMQKMHDQLDQKLQFIIEEHREARKQLKKTRSLTDDKKRTHDFVDVLLDLQEDRNTKEKIEDITIKALILNMMWSGLDVPVNVSEWAMAELVRHPNIQQKLQEELDNVVGKERAVTEADFATLPYLWCVIKETFRMHPAGPFGVPRMSTEATKVAGYDIPARTQVMVSNTELGMNPSLWSDPEVFRPERWQDSNASILQDPELRINPFGIGRRSCPGANLGTQLVLLCVSNLVHAFNWSPARGQRCQDIDMRINFEGLMPMLTTLKPLATARMNEAPPVKLENSEDNRQ